MLMVFIWTFITFIIDGYPTHGSHNSSLAGVALMNKHQQLLLQEGEELHFQQGVLQVQDDTGNEEEVDVVGDGPGGESHGLVPKMPPLMPASMWTRKDMRVFKDTVKKCTENVIRIGSLATATVSDHGNTHPPWTAHCMLNVNDASERKNPITKRFSLNMVHFSYHTKYCPFVSIHSTVFLREFTVRLLTAYFLEHGYPFILHSKRLNITSISAYLILRKFNTTMVVIATIYLQRTKGKIP